MIDHVYISVTNIENSVAFYLEALKPLGWHECGSYSSASGPEGVPDLFGPLRRHLRHWQWGRIEHLAPAAPTG